MPIQTLPPNKLPRLIGTPLHGLVTANVLTLPNSTTVTYPQPDGGGTCVLKVNNPPTLNRTPEQQAQDTVNGYQWYNYGLLSGWDKRIAGTAIGHDKVIYIDGNDNRWLLSITRTFSTTVDYTVTLVSRFGHFGEGARTFNQVLHTFSVAMLDDGGNPVSAANFNQQTYKMIEQNKDGSRVALNLYRNGSWFLKSVWNKADSELILNNVIELTISGNGDPADGSGISVSSSQIFGPTDIYIDNSASENYSYTDYGDDILVTETSIDSDTGSTPPTCEDKTVVNTDIWTAEASGESTVNKSVFVLDYAELVRVAYKKDGTRWDAWAHFYDSGARDNETAVYNGSRTRTRTQELAMRYAPPSACVLDYVISDTTVDDNGYLTATRTQTTDRSKSLTIDGHTFNAFATGGHQYDLNIPLGPPSYGQGIHSTTWSSSTITSQELVNGNVTSNPLALSVHLAAGNMLVTDVYGIESYVVTPDNFESKPATYQRYSIEAESGDLAYSDSDNICFV